ncbi:uncharacterized protein K460DRAFT_405187 [Cucurbitaria berberidis CBS 394.84]|uniref:Uncharacterized protein n=1 Tax=Cucurbitaria berberidis CBS 394.84 TaxID=1168544 RepID=A0A9P4L837_9PLEO|nr:uncharacterized protein K460DRAFT_405187 [Cucurbitaria berberidis CBS 394.84]KAF1844909.1 hypothetical protein K460DRAFT_405187 [Cucurbitaria berberidis CBS 394.84]
MAFMKVGDEDFTRVNPRRLAVNTRDSQNSFHPSYTLPLHQISLYHNPQMFDLNTSTFFFIGGVAGIFVIYSYFIRRKPLPPKQPEEFATHHQRGLSSDFPPGMQFDKVEGGWAKEGMEGPFLRS